MFKMEFIPWHRRNAEDKREFVTDVVKNLFESTINYFLYGCSKVRLEKGNPSLETHNYCSDIRRKCNLRGEIEGIVFKRWRCEK